VSSTKEETVTKVLLVGETWTTLETHVKGWDHFAAARFESGAEPLIGALTGDGGLKVEHLSAHDAVHELPFDVDGYVDIDVVILSDIGADTLLLHPDVWGGQRRANRLAVLADWVRQGGGLAMAGGYLSFQGIQGRGRYRGTPIEDVLPAVMSPYDDRVEAPEGAEPQRTGHDHPIVDGVEDHWPHVLGYNRFQVPEGATVLAEVGPDPMLAVREVGAGRTMAWASDIGPHWCPDTFISWDGYARLWRQAIDWLAG
jgi:uncharacterized membrane protein